MDFLITGFLLWIVNLFKVPTYSNQNRNNDMESGAAYFFGSEDFHCKDSEPINREYDDGPDW